MFDFDMFRFTKVDRKKPPPGGFFIYYVPSSRTVCKRTPSKDLYHVLVVVVSLLIQLNPRAQNVSRP